MRWEVRPLGEVFDIGSSKRVLKSQWSEDGIPFFRTRDLVELAKHGSTKSPLFIPRELYEEFSEKHGVPSKGDLLLSGVGTIGVPYIVGDEEVYFKDANIIWLRPKVDINMKFVSTQLESPSCLRQILDGSMGATVRTLTISRANAISIKVPPLEEQERIVEVLDEAFSAIDKAKANIERNLINARELFQSRLNDIFSNPSEDWEVTSLGEACVFIDYRGRTPKKTDAGIRLITAKNVRMGYVKTDPQEFMSSDEYKDWMTRGIPKKGDVLFTTEAPLANVAMFDFTEKVALAQRIITLSPKLGLSGEFLSFHLQSRPSQLEILSQATGATVSGIKSRLLKLIKIAFPSLESQNFIVDHLEKLKQEVTRLEADYLSELDNLEELRQSILEQAFEGKLTEPVAA